MLTPFLLGNQWSQTSMCDVNTRYNQCRSYIILIYQQVAINNIVENTSVLIDQVKENLKEKIVSQMDGGAESCGGKTVG